MYPESKTIQVYEHQLLLIDADTGFTQKHWQALGWYNHKHGGKYFALTPNGVKFKKYVGVLQVDNLTIEVLPKIGRTAKEEDKSIWQKVLIEMLRECSWMKVFAHEKAALRFKPKSILEAYLEIFIRECENLVKQGLVRKYRTYDNNSTSLKGKLLFSKQVQHNSIHLERFYIRYQEFDHENFFNQVLLKALKIIPAISQSPALKDRVYRLVLFFPDLPDIKIDSDSFDKLSYDRKTLRYRDAIEIAAMLLLNYRPDIKSGRNHVLAILFDMNELWEEYIFRQLLRFKPVHWQVRREIKRFWFLNDNIYKVIKPDIVIWDKSIEKSLIIDTKWKLPEANIPDDADLKQMFAYNEYWNSKVAILLYPNNAFAEELSYIQGAFKNGSTKHNCGVMKTSVLNQLNNALDTTLGQRVILKLKDKSFWETLKAI